MNENKKITREWVKTAAIIFLSIMLVLTFFSNTIMNMNLPEVSTDHIQYGAIKTQVRTSGTVMSVDNYSVTVSDTREVVKVNVRKGDVVNRGDVLFMLEEGESSELEAARENYDNLKYEYDKMVLTSGKVASVVEKEREVADLEEDLAEAKAKLASLDTEIAKITQCEAEIKELNAKIKDVNRRIEAKNREISQMESEKGAIGYNPSEDEVLTGKKSDVTYDQYVVAANQLDEAKKTVEEAEKALNSAKKSKELIDKELVTLPSIDRIESLQNEILQSDRRIEELERNLKYIKQEFYEKTTNNELEDLYDDFEDTQKAYRRIKKQLDELGDDASAEERERLEKELYKAGEVCDNAYDKYMECLTREENKANAEEKALGEAETTLKYAREDNEKLKTEYNEIGADYEKAKELEKKSEELGKTVDVAQSVYDNAVAVKEEIEKSTEKTRNGYKFAKVLEYEKLIDDKEDEIDVLNEELLGYNELLEDKNDELRELEGEFFEDEDSLKEKIKTYERQLLTAKEELQQSREDATDEEKLAKLELEKLKKKTDKAYETLTRLESGISSGQVLAPVSGIIESVNVQPGQKTSPDATLAEISLSERGFKMTATVSQEQAARLRPGIEAEVTSYIPYGSEVKVILDAIKTDTANPGSRQKILEFKIEGSIDPGRNISVSVGDKNASYENTVPNTAIREDSSGKYVLVVDSKSTAISTRYVARKVPVTVIASDDIRSAITGEFDSYAYVVANSSAPISDGDQVKLNEN